MGAESADSITRFNGNAPSIMVAKKNSEFFYSAKMYACSETGMYFESACEFPEGADICIWMGNSESESFGFSTSTPYHAEVEWCREVLDNYTFNYQIRAKISDPLQLRA